MKRCYPTGEGGHQKSLSLLCIAAVYFDDNITPLRVFARTVDFVDSSRVTNQTIVLIFLFIETGSIAASQSLVS